MGPRMMVQRAPSLVAACVIVVAPTCAEKLFQQAVSTNARSMQSTFTCNPYRSIAHRSIAHRKYPTSLCRTYLFCCGQYIVKSPLHLHINL